MKLNSACHPRLEQILFFILILLRFCCMNFYVEKTKKTKKARNLVMMNKKVT